MFDFLGRHKIGVLGGHHGGKTIFLTSLLWHLSSHDPERFRLRGGDRVQAFAIRRHPDHDFGFARHRNTFVQDRRWPAKTCDYGLASCTYSRSGCLLDRDLTFLDIPGERMADVLMWLAPDYPAWARALAEFWDDNPRVAAAMADYRRLAADPGNDLGALENAYRAALLRLLAMYCPVTPSTFLLGDDGRMLGDDGEPGEDRPLWAGGRLLPLPPCWQLGRPDVYATMADAFRRYRREVVDPLFSEIGDCDHFIVCVDVLNLLAAGPARLLQEQQEIRACLESVAPSFFGRLLTKLGAGGNRLAFVATKADLVDAANKDRLQALLRDFARPLVPEGVRCGQFITAACVSSEYKEKDGERVLTGWDAHHLGVELRLDYQLPAAWPDDWAPGDWRFPEIVPQLSLVRPPRQVNLDAVFEFVVEGITL